MPSADVSCVFSDNFFKSSSRFSVFGVPFPLLFTSLSFRPVLFPNFNGVTEGYPFAIPRFYPDGVIVDYSPRETPASTPMA
jgi:hypothetical protein